MTTLLDHLFNSRKRILTGSLLADIELDSHPKIEELEIEKMYEFVESLNCKYDGAMTTFEGQIFSDEDLS